MVIFDLGGVVVRICRTWPEACATAGIPYRHVDTTPDGIARRKSIVHLYETAQITCEQYFDRLAATMNGHYNPAEVRALHDAWITSEYHGLSDIIDHLHAQHIPTGVLSNTNHHHWQQMTTGPHGRAKFPTPQRVRYLHASHLLGLAKPDRAIYHRFAQLVCPAEGLTPADLLFFDDLQDNVDAAKGAGWQAHLIDHTADPAAQVRTHLDTLGVRV